MIASKVLDVVLVVSNPLRWASREQLCLNAIRHMQDCASTRVTVVECQFGSRDFVFKNVPGINFVGVRSKTLVWNKENLINIGINRLPEGWEYVAWIDADIVFRKLYWAQETIEALQQYDIVQPWADCYDLGPNDEHLTAHKSFCRQLHHDEPVLPAGNKQWKGQGGPYEYPHSGYAWAATRQFLEWTGGLIETSALGAADHHMALALVGRVDLSVPGGIGDAYMRPLKQWQQRARHHSSGNIGYVPGTIEHQWHGPKVKRNYIGRWDILVQEGFDPDVDLKRNTYGVIELTGNKPTLRHKVDRYFRLRDEDGNTL